MSMSPPMERRQEQDERLVAVALSEVPLELRQEVADRLRGSESGEEALLEWGLAVVALRQDPILRVPLWKARLVLRAQQLPAGDFPKF